MAFLGLTWSVTYIDDGSTDATGRILQQLRADDPAVSVLSLSRNFGKEVAVTAGLDHADADAVIIIDADGQDPPETIPLLVDAWRAGADVAYAQRRRRAGDTFVKRLTSAGFYRIMAGVGRLNMPRDTGDFRIMSRRAMLALNQLREHHRFMKGLFAWIGFEQVPVPYDRAPRIAGKSKWNYWQLWNLAVEGITGFTVLPLKIATYTGLLIAISAVLYGLYIILDTLIYGNTVAGYPSLITVMLLLGGIQLIFLGVIGEYLGRVFNEVKQRPLYLIKHDPTTAAAPRTGDARLAPGTGDARLAPGTGDARLAPQNKDSPTPPKL